MKKTTVKKLTIAPGASKSAPDKSYDFNQASKDTMYSAMDATIRNKKKEVSQAYTNMVEIQGEKLNQRKTEFAYKQMQDINKEGHLTKKEQQADESLKIKSAAQKTRQLNLAFQKKKYKDRTDFARTPTSDLIPETKGTKYADLSLGETKQLVGVERSLGVDPKTKSTAAAKAIMKRNKMIGKGLGIVGSFIRNLKQGH